MGVTPSKRLVSFGAALAVGFAGVATTGTASFATEAAVAGAQFEANGNKLAKDSQVQGYAKGEDGKVLVFKLKGDKLGKDAQKFIRAHKNVEVVEMNKPANFTAGEVVAGHPHINVTDQQDGSVVCSAGFAMLSAKFTPQIASAGHCSSGNIGDPNNFKLGEAKTLLWGDPSTSPAVGGEGEQPDQSVQGKLKAFRMGGPGQMEPDGSLPNGSTEFPNGEQFIDFATYDLTKYSAVYPRVSTWKNTSDMLEGSLSVQKVQDAKVGDKVARSGRTTGFDSGPVEETGWMNISGRMIKGFGGPMKTEPGDSGGPGITESGGAAGVLSGHLEMSDGTVHAWFSDIRNDLDQIGEGSRVLVDKAPKVDGAKATAAGAKKTVKGAGAAAAAPVEVKVPEGGTLTGSADSMFTGGTFVVEGGKEVPVTVKDGKWSFKAPGKEGDTVTGNLFLHTKYEVSLPLAISYTVTKAATPEPTPEPTETPEPTQEPTQEPTESPEPTEKPTTSPEPTQKPTQTPTQKPEPTEKPTENAKPALAVSPKRIDVDDFAGDGEKNEKLGVTYKVTGVKPGTTVTFETEFGGKVVRTSTGKADADGVAVARVWGESGPREGFLGKYSVTAKFGDTELTGGFEVVDGDVQSGDNDKSDNSDKSDGQDGSNGKNTLPRTGTSALAATGVALGMVAIGGGLVVASRRRKA